MTPEGKVKADVKKYLKSIGCWYFLPVSNGMGQVGIPDFICCYRGLFVAVETKAPGKINNTTANQDRVIGEIKNAEGFAIVVDNVEQLKAALATIHLGGNHDQIDTEKTRVPKSI